MSDVSIPRKFFRYVTPNIFGMIGISAYMLADTYFIAKGVGADGLTALNLVLPLYSLLFGIGNMIAIGSATRFRLLRAMNSPEADQYFGNALFFAFLCSLPFMIVAIFFHEPLLLALGARGNVLSLGTTYTMIFMSLAPCFMWSHICDAFVRNDGSPRIAMIATLASSLFNIVMDYVLMFPLGMGIAGASLATAISPLVAIAINSSHLLSARSSLSVRGTVLSFVRFINSCRLGIAALVGELALGITTLVFNFIILALVGNIGVAAYGVIANIAYVAGAIFNGLSQGAQPLFSQYYGEKHWLSLAKSLELALATGFAIAVVIVAVTHVFADPIAAIFNSEGNAQMQTLAVSGVKLYFPGYLLASLNLAATSYLAATTAANWATLTSLLRGIIATVPCALVLSHLLGMTGVWITFASAEAITLVVVCFALHRCNSRYRRMMGAQQL
ncbi:MAG: MATE family efflux transporter [Peptococcaceae bacterium]|nr:MATE family efflux transporter [Peptococcaceae bacterium]